MAARTFALFNLGCKVNQVDGQIMRERLQAFGWREASAGEPVGLCIVNTCTVTGRADAKARQMVRRLHREHPEAKLLVTGCGAVSEKERFAAMEGVAAVLTREEMAHVEEFLERDTRPAPGDPFQQGITAFEGRTRAFLRIQDGCEAGCSYCIVPRVRGPLRSRPLDAVRREAERLAAGGHIEIVLTGIHVGRYGAETGGAASLADAVRATLAAPGVARVRLSSIESGELSDALLDIAATDPRFCPHFHVPLQSGDDAVLRAMNRRATAAEYLRCIERIRARLDRPSLTTDVIAGFPGETDAQFEATLAVCRAAAFSRIHIFPFSPRPGTPAAHLPGRVPPHVVRARVRRLNALADELALAYKRGFLHAVVRPLVETRRDTRSGLLTGWTERYLRTEFEGGDVLKGRIVAVRVESATADRLRGRLATAQEDSDNATRYSPPE